MGANVNVLLAGGFIAAGIIWFFLTFVMDLEKWQRWAAVAVVVGGVIKLIFKF